MGMGAQEIGFMYNNNMLLSKPSEGRRGLVFVYFARSRRTPKNSRALARAGRFAALRR
jgi:hypothetical protein